jgi:16S rRNA (guanine(966)-N(2))-methyltransferase RsmD
MPPAKDVISAPMRIIGGRAGGRSLKAPRGDKTRPTSDKVREALFNILASRGDIPARVLDLYAGSGALGLEALSRGAQSALFVEVERDSCELIRENAARLEIVQTHNKNVQTHNNRQATIAATLDVVCMPVVRWLSREAQPAFDLIFLDPPYESHQTGELEKALELVAKKQLVAAGGIAIAEHDWRHGPEEAYGTLALFDRRRYGQTAVSFYAAPSAHKREDGG